VPPDGTEHRVTHPMGVGAAKQIRHAGKMLVAYDGTPSARRALQRAAVLHQVGARLGLIYVSERGDDRDGHLEEGRLALAASGIEADSMAVAGSAAHAICIAAERDGYDTIVIGRRNLRDAGQLLLGSVASRVVAGATCDVVVVA
jgi:nucleotide-binding universal stress UspA family protein